MRGKYQRRKRARSERDSGGVATTPRPMTRASALAFRDALMEAQRLKRSKKKGTANLDRNMESLGYRRIAGSDMVAEQFEAIS